MPSVPAPLPQGVSSAGAGVGVGSGARSGSGSVAAASSSALAGTITLVLRPAGRSAQLVSLIESAGGEALVSPLITREPIADDQSRHLDQLITDLGSFEWVAVTSVNAVSELVSAMRRANPASPIVEQASQVSWATVGGATTAALAEHGIVVEFEANENSALGMLKEWPDTTPNSRRVLLPLGDLASTQLEDGLTARGYTCERVNVYRTVSHPATDQALGAWRDGDVDAVILTSGSIVREFARQFDPLSVIPEMAPYFPLFIAIGEPTTRAAAAVGLSVDIVAKSATQQGLFDALVRAVALTLEEN